jgi:hypothetical protein
MQATYHNLRYTMIPKIMLLFGDDFYEATELKFGKKVVSPLFTAHTLFDQSITPNPVWCLRPSQP